MTQQTHDGTVKSIVPVGKNSCSQGKDCRTVWMFAMLLTLAGLIAYENSFAGVFHFDDYPCIVTNHSLTSLAGTWNATAEEIPGGLRRRAVGRWTFALNRSLHGLDLWGYHAVNLLIHLAAGLFLMGLVRRTLRLPPAPPILRHQSAVLAFCVALLWLVHPLQTESVTYIVQRLEALMGMFFLACLYGLNRGATDGSRGWYGFAIAAAGLSIGTKEVGLMIVPVALLYDRLFLATTWSDVLRRRAWVHGPVLCAALLYFVVGIGKVPYYVDPPDSAGRRATSWEYLRSQPGVLLHYFRLSFWPKDLCLDYVWQIAHHRLEIYGKGALILGILATGFVLLWRLPSIAFLILSYFIILAPSSTIVPLHLAFEHRVYLSLATLICGVVLACFGLFTLAGSRIERCEKMAAAGTLSLSVLAAVALTWATRERNQIYHSQVGMWKDVVRVSPHNSRGHMNLANYAAADGDLDVAEQHYRIGLRLDPDFSQLLYNYAYFLVTHRQQPQQALPFYERAVEAEPGKAVFHFGCAHVLEQLDRVDDAEAKFRRGLELEPKDVIAHLRLGQLLKNQQRFDEAEAHLERAAQLGPYLWQPHRELGQIDAARKDLSAAIAHYEFAQNAPRVHIPAIFKAELAELRNESSAEGSAQ
ncbi:tetratricopeptide repeat protein [Rhodopirellula sp. JC639]|uniref:tetratricopeptide repeat protein n=1 Tax=Stieleria mannarensis TaxID=2755585 RepID=UPI0016030275|nr:tetratricopeptide repeat protein [Rhodopirellula sp. JC639]